MKKGRFGSVELINISLVFWYDKEHTKFTTKEINNKTGNSLPTTSMNLNKLVNLKLVDKIPINNKDSFYKKSVYMNSLTDFTEVCEHIIKFDSYDMNPANHGGGISDT